jgi:hypothetical protein
MSSSQSQTKNRAWKVSLEPCRQVFRWISCDWGCSHRSWTWQFRNQSVGRSRSLRRGCFRVWCPGGSHCWSGCTPDPMSGRQRWTLNQIWFTYLFFREVLLVADVVAMICAAEVVHAGGGMLGLVAPKRLLLLRLCFLSSCAGLGADNPTASTDSRKFLYFLMG